MLNIRLGIAGVVFGVAFVACEKKEAEKPAVVAKVAPATKPSVAKSDAPPAPVHKPLTPPTAADTGKVVESAPAAPPKPPPRITFKEKEFSFGNVIEGDETKHSFEFTNEGPGDLVLTNVQPSCGCTTKKMTVMEPEGSVEKDYVLGTPIRPGQIGHIEAILNTQNIHGNKTSRISVVTNDPQNPTTMLQISAQVEQFFQMEPPHIYQGSIVGKIGGESLVKVTCVKADAFEIKGWDALPEGIDLQVAKPDPAKKNYAEIKVIFKPGIKEGVFNHQLVLKTEVPGLEKQRDIRLVVTGTVQGPILFTPAFLGLGLGKRGQLNSGVVTVTNKNPDETLKLLGVEIDSPQKGFLQAKISEEMVGQTFKITLTAQENMPPGVFKGTLKIKTDNKEKPELTISFSGVIR